jgi:hypothetical protein
MSRVVQERGQGIEGAGVVRETDAPDRAKNAPDRSHEKVGRSEEGAGPVRRGRGAGQKKWKRLSGQMRRSTLPTMRDLGMGPQNRLSQESPRLSPIMK